MSERDNIDQVQRMYDAFGRGDIAHIIDQLADDVAWKSNLDPVVPWSGNYSGKGNVQRFFDAIATGTEVSAFEPQEWVAEGDTVVTQGRFAGHSRTLGKPFDTRWIFVWKLRDGRVQSYEQYHDPAIAEAFR